jgi:hypothetical protein
MKSMIHKRKIPKLNFMKIKFSCFVNDIVKGIKRQATHWEKMFTNRIADKEFIPKIYKELSKLVSKKIISSLKKKWAKDWNGYFTKEDKHWQVSPGRKAQLCKIGNPMKITIKHTR